jgi:hypothetical protein
LAAPRDKKHLFVAGRRISDPYRPHGRKISTAPAPAPQSRSQHGKALLDSYAAAVEQAADLRSATGQTVSGARPGLYVQFESQPGAPLNLSSLEDARKGIELVAVTTVATSDEAEERIERATVFVPEGKVSHFIKRFEAYSNDDPRKAGERRHESMLDPIASLRLATLRALWTDDPSDFPADNMPIWWEVWLRRTDGNEVSRLQQLSQLTGLSSSGRKLEFDDRIITLAWGTATQLAGSLLLLNDLAELRAAKECATFFQNLETEEQAAWSADLLNRLSGPSENSPSVCVLDTGVNHGHPLLSAALDSVDCHSCVPAWGTHDHHGHGTEMGGLALFGDLTPLLAGTMQIGLSHRLESVKILPPTGSNNPDLYGAIMAQATSRVEIQAPSRQRCFSMAVTATDERDRGQPTSWSASIDALAAGRSFDPVTEGLVYIDGASDSLRRLFVISAGNVDGGSLHVNHLDRSDSEAVHDPAQAWNALTVGAMTEKVVISSTSWHGWQPVSAEGDLSPWSTTGVTFSESWPNKPDVVIEGGNVVKNSLNEIDFPCDDLNLLTTHFKPAERVFATSCATSAACAQVSGMAAAICANYPELWAESIRALIVHSAEWTPPMLSAIAGATGKRARARLLRRYGFGVPRLDRAIRSASDSLTLIVQERIRPFDKGKMGEMHLFNLPWPIQTLRDMAEAQVKLRVTLSYFIEPNPGRRGWRSRHRYASHGLRFDVKSATESIAAFQKRLNERALEENESKPKISGDSNDWLLGEQARNHGSIHSDVLEGTAADIAERGVIGVFPVGGWWKDLPKRDRSAKGCRYSLIVSIESPESTQDIWTPVANEIATTIATPV